MPYFYKADFQNFDSGALVGRIVSEISSKPSCNEFLLNPVSTENLKCSAILLTEQKEIHTDIPVVICTELCWQPGAGVRLDSPSKRVSLLYSAESNANALFLTERCNCNCIMCPQPPKENDPSRLEEILELIKCLPDNLTELGITGGEPTILEDEFIRVLVAIKERFPECAVHVLSNARLLSNKNYVQAIRNVGLPNLSFGIPIYSSDPSMHDFIVQSKGAFDQTIDGIYNLAENGIPVEVRTVIHQQTYQGLLDLSNFIYSSLPFVYHIAFMGMEHMGYVKKNWNSLWIHPKEYQEQLHEAVRFLHMRGMNVSIYNLPLCFLDQRLWKLARKSISDYKDVFPEPCQGCKELTNCGGIFNSQVNSYELQPFK